MSAAGGPVAIIGAGPYGLAAAAHLRTEGVETLAFGEAMSFWEENMPRGMWLRSSRRSSSISDPRREFTLDDYEKTLGEKLPKPMTLERFIEYGRWFSSQVMPQLDSRRVARVEAAPGGFTLDLEDGERVAASRVVVAGGIAPFAFVPKQFAGLPPELMTHSAYISDPSKFAGRRC